MFHCLATSHINFCYLRTPEKLTKFRQMQIALDPAKQKVKKLELSLEKANQLDRVLVDQNTNIDLLSTMSSNRGAMESTNNKNIQSIFWEQQLKAKSCKGKQGMRWHPAIIRWCMYLHHHLSGAYSTLRKSDVLVLPSEHTLRDYCNFAPSTTSISKEIVFQLLHLLSKYITIVVDEMYIKEGLVFDKSTGTLIGYGD